MRRLLKRHVVPLQFLFAGMLLAVCLGSAAMAHAQCSNPPNQIVAENCLTGNPDSEWDVKTSDAGDPTIQGFGTDISVNVGGTAVFKISTPATAYTINIYRMGYYGGMGARKVATITPSAHLPQNQPACLTDTSTKLTDCGNWAPSASWQVPSNATSGIYFAHLIRNDTGGDSHIVFIVRNDSSHSDILFQTSDESWQAYNYYGTGSLYGPGLPQFDLGNRAYKVSYNRPFYTRGLNPEQATWVFGTEYPMVRWLEANGYDVSYFTGVDAARYGSLITNHKVYTSTGHDEYWSGPQRINVEAARDAGVNMAFFSGNEVFWKTRWENSIDGSGTQYRTVACYKETLAFSKIDPSDPPTWTGTWRDPSFSPPADGGRPENSLTGTLFMVNGPGVDNDGSLRISVPAADGKMRFWRNTAVASQAPNHTYTMAEGTLGYEWDEDIDNGARPGGAFPLSTTTYPMSTDLLLDYGATYGGGSATHHLMMYRAPSGALVFGAGTVQWSWGLDNTHDNPFGFQAPAPDVNMQQATLNLLADMGAQPGSKQSGLVAATASTDTAAPVSTITAPIAGAQVQAGNIVTIAGVASDTGGGVVGGVEVSTDGGHTWHPAQGRGTWTYAWRPATLGSASLMSRAVDDSGNLENPLTSGGNPPGGVVVTVIQQTCPCNIWNSSTAPSNPDSGDGSAIEVGVKFRSDFDGYITGIRFYKAAANTGTHVGHLWTSSGTLLGSVTFVGETNLGWQEVHFTSPIPVLSNTTYVASYYAPAGHYSVDLSYFVNHGADNPPLHALANGVDGPDGLYSYSTTGTFPLRSFASSNYWVDVAFVEGSTAGISGTISGIGGAGATVTLSGATNATTVTDSSGNYNFSGLVNGGYTITPSNPGVVFSPPSQTVTINNASLTGVNFTAAPIQPVSIAGNISGSGGPGATVTLTGAANATTTADALGNYAFNGLLSGTYTITPGNAGFIFTPGSQTLTASSNLTGVNFTSQQCSCYTIWPAATPTLIDSGDPSAIEVGVRFRADYAGYITGVRFYKSSSNVGTHIGHLWTNSGTLLATATFTNETASGWQQVSFNPPVFVAPNTTYVVGYFAPSGHYSANQSYFTTGVDNPPLHAPADGVYGANGIYTYSSAPAFPTSSYASTNYWVDVVFAIAPSYSISGTLSGAGSAGATVTLGGTGIGSTTADNSGNYTFNGVLNGTYFVTPSNTGYIFIPGSQTVTVNGSSVSGVNFTTPPNCPCNTIWPAATIPTVIDSGDGSSVEVGVRFRADHDGYILGLRFYKSLPNIGTHLGNLWSNTGTLLGTATFTSESGSGWQQVLFGNPIPVQGNTTYVASYFAPAGHYSADPNYFANNGTDSPPLHALQNGIDGPTGVYQYSPSSRFPTSSFQSDNYWVDVVYVGAQTYSIAGTISGPGGPGAVVNLGGTSNGATTADGSGNYSFSGLANGSYSVTPSNTGYAFTPATQTVTINGGHNLGVNFTSAVQTFGLSGTITGPGGAGATVTLTGTANASTTADGSGNYSFTGLQNGSYTVTPGNAGYLFTPPSQVETINGASLSGINFTGSVLGYTVTGTIAGPGGAGATVTLSGTARATTIADGSGNYSFSGLLNGLYTVTPSSAAYIYMPISQAVTINGGNVSGVNFTVPQNCPCETIWSPLALPALIDSGDATATEIGVRFRADNDGYITGVRFYKATGNTGTHIGNVWSNSGTLLSRATFTAESGSGWQQVFFANPIPVKANTTYVASYFAPVGHYSADASYFATSGFDNPPLHALGNGIDGADGVYQYSASSTFPASTYQSDNYWVDVIYTVAQTYTISGNISGLGGPGATVTLSGSSNGTTTADGSGNYMLNGLLNGSYTITPSNAGFTFSPTAQNVTISDGHNLGINFSTAAQVQQPQTITFGPLANQTYGAAPLPLSATASSGLPVTFRVVSGPATISLTTLTLTGAGTVTVEADQSGNNQWLPAPPVQQSVMVNKAVLNVTANSASMTYGGALPAFSASYSGFVNGDGQGVLSGAPSLTTSALPASPVGTYAILAAQGSLVAVNYSFVFQNGTLTVNAAPLTVSANSLTMSYGSTLPPLTFGAIGFQNGDTLASLTGSPALSTTATSASVPGTYPITISQGTLRSTNYVFTFVNGTMTVIPAVLNVTATNLSSTYGATVPTLTYSITGFVNGDNQSMVTGSPVLSTTGTSHSPAGTYPITVTAGTLGINSKYTFAFINGNLTINKAVLQVNAKNATMTYGGVLPGFTAGYFGFVNGDGVGMLSGQPSLTTSATQHSPVGTYTITASIGTLTSANYSFTFVNGTLTINRALLTVKANNLTRQYGQSNPPLTYAITGFVNGDTQSVVSGQAGLSTTATQQSHPGAYNITILRGTLAAANYNFVMVNGTLTITKATTTISWTPSTNRIRFGTQLGTGILDATVVPNIAGTMVYTTVINGVQTVVTPSTVLPVGTYTITARFAPSDTTDYTGSTAQQVITVTS